MVRFVLLVMFVFLTADRTRPPAPPVERAPMRAAIPALPEHSNWGNTAQDGKAFTLEGHPVWSAHGLFRDDGKVVIMWTLLASGELCPGVYSVVMVDGNVELHGEWGYATDTRIDAEGKLIGEVRRDRVYSVIVPAGL